MAKTKFPNYTAFKLELQQYLEPGQGAQAVQYWENVGAFNHSIWSKLAEGKSGLGKWFFSSDLLQRKVEDHLTEMTEEYESKMRKGRARTVMQLMIGYRRWYFVLSTGNDHEVIVWHWPVSEKMRDVLDLVETPFT